jgi:hypothetical protein
MNVSNAFGLVILAKVISSDSVELRDVKEPKLTAPSKASIVAPVLWDVACVIFRVPVSPDARVLENTEISCELSCDSFSSSAHPVGVVNVSRCITTSTRVSPSTTLVGWLMLILAVVAKSESVWSLIVATPAALGAEAAGTSCLGLTLGVGT